MVDFPLDPVTKITPLRQGPQGDTRNVGDDFQEHKARKCYPSPAQTRQETHKASYQEGVKEARSGLLEVVAQSLGT